MKSRDSKKITIYIILITVLTAIDQLTKLIFTNKSYFENSLISINYTQNLGSAFGIFSQVPYYQQIIAILSVIVLVFLFIKYRDFTKTKLMQFSYILIVSGIISNLIDRVFFFYVRDFISIKYLFIFNLADLCLTLGVIGLILHEILSENKTLKSKNKIEN